MPPTEARIVIVGAGAAGLAAAAALQRRRIDAVLLEADDRVGGSWDRRYDRLRLHTVRRFSGLPYQGVAADLPRYVTKDDYARYLADYAAVRSFDLRLGRRATQIEPTREGWLVRTEGGDFAAHVVVVATGKHRRPRLPRWPGMEDFAGRILHSADYRSGSAFAGKRVLVVGIGNSGAEIATDLVEQRAAFVAIAVRNAPPIVRRQIAGVPVQVLGILLSPFPSRPVDRLGAAMRRVAIGDLTRYGLGKPTWGPFEARRPPVIDVGFLDTLTAGLIGVRPEVTRFTADAPVFADGRAEAFDGIVAATGFSTGLDELITLPDVLDKRGMPDVASDGVSPHRGLYFIGFQESPRGALYEANRDARKLARSIARYLARPPDA
jgi:putative flavoprotein involved in K+ transport